VLRLHRSAPELRRAGRPYQVEHVPEAHCWTEVPEHLGGLASQRIRWQRGLLESLMEHRGMLFAPRHGLIGLVVLPTFWVIDVLGSFSTLLGFLMLPWLVLQGQVPAWHLNLFLIATIGIGAVTSLLAISVESRAGGVYRHPAQVAALAAISMLEVFGYRQLNTWWRIRGTWNHLMGRNSRWKSIERSEKRRSGGTTLVDFAKQSQPDAKKADGSGRPG
jgi:hypothetical protein